jgi:hypothetical protein
MVRTYTFAAMVGVAYLAVSSLDSVFEWMADRQEKKVPFSASFFLLIPIVASASRVSRFRFSA